MKKCGYTAKKIDITHQEIIVNWIAKNLENTAKPRVIGKSLKIILKSIGYYRIISEINDDEIRILIIGIGHRREIYKKI